MKKLGAALVVILALFLPAKASAHVFFRDKSGTSGAVMHVTPDDDPIAGETAEFYFELEDSAPSTEEANYLMYVINDGSQDVAATRSAGERSVAASYVFPSQGAYTIELHAYLGYDPANQAAADDPVIFAYDMRVTRGTAVSPLDQPRFAWAEAGLVMSITSLAAVLVAAAARRQAILSYTKDK